MIFSGSWANTLVIEILVVLAVVKAFRAMAAVKGLNKALWGWIGGLSYYVPILCFGIIIFPFLLEKDLFPLESKAMVGSFSILNLLVGVSSCGGTYLYLKSKPNTKSKNELDIIDQV